MARENIGINFFFFFLPDGTTTSTQTSKRGNGPKKKRKLFDKSKENWETNGLKSLNYFQEGQIMLLKIIGILH